MTPEPLHPRGGDEHRWLTIPEAASRFSVSPHTIRRWIREGRLSAVKRHGRYGEQFFVPGDATVSESDDRPPMAASSVTASGHVIQPLPQSETLVGRDDEIERIQRALRIAETGQGSLILVGGEAGIGKTTLVSFIAEQAMAANWSVMTGQCYDLEVTPPYGPWIELIRSHQSLTTSTTPAAPAAPTLTTDELGDIGGQSGLFSHVWSFIGALSEQVPVLLVLEDMHWADQASLELLRYLARQIRSHRVLIVVTYRDLELTTAQPLYRMLPLIVRECPVERITLRHLNREAIRDLITARYELSSQDRSRLIDFLVRYSQGNPFFIGELLRSLEGEDFIREKTNGVLLADLGGFHVPPLIQQVIDSRLSRLDPEARDLLQVASVIGDEVPIDLWLDVTSSTVEQLSLVIEQSLDAHVLVEVPDRPSVRFRHALIRQALYQRTLFLRRRHWHRRVGEMLARSSSPDPDAVAHHFQQGADDDRAMDWLLRAGRRAAGAFAYEIAVARYEQALPILERHPDRQLERGWLLCELAESYRYSDSHKALRYADAALEIADHLGDLTLKAVVLRSRGHVRGFLSENGLPEVEASVALYESLPADDRARIRQRSLGYTMSPGTYAQRIAYYGLYRLAYDTAREFLDGDRDAGFIASNLENAIAYMGVALGAAGLGYVQEARDAFAKSREFFARTGNTYSLANSLEFEYTAVLEVYLADHPDERRTYIDEVDRLYSQSFYASLTDNGGTMRLFSALIHDGRWEEVRVAATAIAEIQSARVTSLTALVELDRLQGLFDQGLSRIHQVLPDGPDTEPGTVFFDKVLVLLRLAAEIAVEEEDLIAARRWIECLERWLESSNIVPGRAVPDLLRAECSLLESNILDARQQAERALAAASSPRQPLLLLMGHRLLARIRLRLGDDVAAAHHFDQAITLARACEVPYEVALTQLVLVDLLRHQGRLAEARELIDEVRRVAEALGSRPLLRQCERRDIRVGQARPGIADAIGLSPREIEVLQLIARGMTDAEVADSLFISPRTVSGHLQSIYNKLGISSRTAATAFAYEHQLI